MTNASRTEAQSSLWMGGHKILSTCSSSLPVLKRCNPGIRQAGSLGAAQQVGCVCLQQQQQPLIEAVPSPRCQHCLPEQPGQAWGVPAGETTPKTLQEKPQTSWEGLQSLLFSR